MIPWKSFEKPGQTQTRHTFYFQWCNCSVCQRNRSVKHQASQSASVCVTLPRVLPSACPRPLLVVPGPRWHEEAVTGARACLSARLTAARCQRLIIKQQPQRRQQQPGGLQTTACSWPRTQNTEASTATNDESTNRGRSSFWPTAWWPWLALSGRIRLNESSEGLWWLPRLSHSLKASCGRDGRGEPHLASDGSATLTRARAQ